MDAGRVSAGIAVAVAAVVLCGLVVALVFKWHPTCAAACPPPSPLIAPSPEPCDPRCRLLSSWASFRNCP